jgi:hypothetical protein
MGNKPKHRKAQKLILIVGVIVAIVAGLNTQVKATAPDEPQQLVQLEHLDKWVQKIKQAPEALVKVILPR